MKYIFYIIAIGLSISFYHCFLDIKDEVIAEYRQSTQKMVDSNLEVIKSNNNLKTSIDMLNVTLQSSDLHRMISDINNLNTTLEGWEEVN